MRALFPALFAGLLLPALATPVSAQRAQPGWIGIAIDQPAEDRGRADDQEVVIAAVYRDSPAERAGLRRGDRLLSVGDLDDAEDFRNLPERLRLRAGESVLVRIQRDGRARDFVLRAVERPDDVRSRTLVLSVEPDSLVETMVRAMDSLRVQLARMPGIRDPRMAVPGPVRVVGSDDPRPSGVSAPFEFFVFRGEAHDSLREAWEELSRVTRELRLDEQRRLRELRRSAGRTGLDEDRDPELRSVRMALEEVSRRSAELRSAMSEAARVTAGFDFTGVPRPDPGPAADPGPGTPEPAPAFSPLTPYLVGSNMVAGAQVVDLNPGLARYFDVEGGVLVVEVAPGTPAALAGVVPGDVITRLDQVAVRTVQDLRLGVSRSGESLPLRLVREGQTLEVLLTRR